MTAAAIVLVQTYVDSNNRTESVLVLARDVPWNQRITDTDLTVANATPDPHVHMIAATQRNDVIGRVAAHSLTAGSLLTAEQLTDHAIPGPGQLLVGLLVKPGQLPARGLRPEDHVQIVSGAQPTVGSTTVGDHPAVQATVVDVGPPNASDGITVDVVVDIELGAALTSMAATGPVLVSLVGPQK
ncbi:SAF domain-containing protein [Actinocrispum wychmicini]|nr:SAF domain-containing protein [Actinocrispum wychmicini]